jgi:N-acetyl-gamma-glutamyl-phosphate reductase
MYKVFVDGQEGTTGLKILDRFEGRTDIELLKIDEAGRKDPAERGRLINESDFTFLCLPDNAAKESVSLVRKDSVRIIDASTAHRTASGWDYGFPELSPKHRENIKNSKRVAVPGCHATGFIALVYPLIHSGLVQPHYPVFAYSLTGYSGAGRQTIAQYEKKHRPPELSAPMVYGLSQEHKHIPEMLKMSGLAYKPMFTPIIADYYSGMTVVVPFQSRLLQRRVRAADFWAVLSKHYENEPLIGVKELMTGQEQSKMYLPSNYLSDTNKMEIFVFGSDDRIVLCACFDNLGKGASGAAVQCMDIMMSGA